MFQLVLSYQCLLTEPELHVYHQTTFSHDGVVLTCHALVLVFCVFFINLVRPGCDMGLLCGVFL